MALKKLTFNKEDGDLWYVDLPDWPGAKAELLMVSGADTLLDIIAGKKRSVLFAIDLEPFEGASLLTLERKGDEEGGGHYFIERLGDQRLELKLWLCDVTNFVFGFIPARIFIKPMK